MLNHTAGVYDIVNHEEGEYFVDSIFAQDPEFTMTIDIMTSFISKNQLYDLNPEKPGDIKQWLSVACQNN